MPREVYKNDYTVDELQNLKNGKCWCGIPRDKFQKGMRVYCKPAHRKEWYLRTIAWSGFRDNFLEKHGTKCDFCKVSKSVLEKNYQKDLKNWYEKIKANPELMKIVEEERQQELLRIDEQYRIAFDDEHMIGRTFKYNSMWGKNLELNVPKYPKEPSDFSSKFELDHIVPVAQGGAMWDEENLQVLCVPCHKEKTKLDMVEITKYKHKRKNL